MFKTYVRRARLIARRALNGALAAITTPTAVRAEKSLFVLVVTRALLAAGASVETVHLVIQLLKAVGA